MNEKNTSAVTLGRMRWASISKSDRAEQMRKIAKLPRKPRKKVKVKRSI
jgi:hypothetical protein